MQVAVCRTYGVTSPIQSRNIVITSGIATRSYSFSLLRASISSQRVAFLIYWSEKGEIMKLVVDTIWIKDGKEIHTHAERPEGHPGIEEMNGVSRMILEGWQIVSQKNK